MPERLPMYGLAAFCKACRDGDLALLTTMLDRGDPVQGFQGDINQHHAGYTAMHYAAVHGQQACVEALLEARADPHVRMRMPRGRDPADGRTASQLADDWGWDELAAVLRASEGSVSKGDYLAAGPLNNAKIYPTALLAAGRELEQVARVHSKLASLRRPYFRERAELDTSVGLLFPGQGSQHAPMLAEVRNLPQVKAMLDSARSILGWDVADVCTSGSKLDRAEFCHPAVFVADLAALEMLRQDLPDVAARPGAVAGLGVGEFAALVAAGVLPFEDALRVVKARSEAVAAAAADPNPPQALLSVAGVRRGKLASLCRSVEEAAGGQGACAVVHELFPKGATCGGTRTLVERLQVAAKEHGALQAKLVEGAAEHTTLMAAAAPKLQEVLDEVLTRMRPPTCDVYMNCSGIPISAGSHPKRFVPLLLQQLTQPVRWETSVRNMIKAGVSEFYEVGPKRQLKAMMKRIDAQAHARTTNVEA